MNNHIKLYEMLHTSRIMTSTPIELTITLNHKCSFSHNCINNKQLSPHIKTHFLLHNVILPQMTKPLNILSLIIKRANVLIIISFRHNFIIAQLRVHFVIFLAKSQQNAYMFHPTLLTAVNCSDTIDI